MTVYVDNARNPYGRMYMSHMIADTLEELHEMAEKLGMKREWFQDARLPHYDISLGKRNRAIDLGAVQVDSYELISILKSTSAET